MKSLHTDIASPLAVVLDGSPQLISFLLVLQARDLEYLLVSLDLLFILCLSLSTGWVDPLATDPPCELHVLAHDGDSPCMDGT
jgi:hypothetical protein